MSMIEITIRIGCIVLLLAIAGTFRWTLRVSRRVQLEAILQGCVATRVWPVGTWGVRLLAALLAIAIAVRLVQGVAGAGS